MKWLLQNVRRRAGFAIKNPRYALNAVVREFTLADEKFLARLTGSSPRQIRMYLHEPVNTPALAAHLRAEEQHFSSLSINSFGDFARTAADARSADTARCWLPPEELGVRLNRQSPGLAETAIGYRRQ